MTGHPDRKEGELSAEESLLAKQFFVALGFILSTVVIVGFESFVDFPYVILGVIIVGAIVVVKVTFSTGIRTTKSLERTE